MAVDSSSLLGEVGSSSTDPRSGSAGQGSAGRDLDSLLRNSERRKALSRTQLLDSEPEESFDRLTRLAAKLIGVPVTFISLIDEQRDFYKSCFGFGEPLSSTRTMEGRTFCHYTLVESGALLIPDTMADPAFRDVPTVQSLGVRAYAGIPLITDDGQAIGSFCAIDFEPRQWSPLDVEILTELAASAMREIKLRAAVIEAKTQARTAQEATRAREEVLAVVAHDLRTPLNFIKMGAQLIADPAHDDTLTLAERMNAAAELMSVLINDLLEAAKIEAGGMLLDARPLDVQQLLDDAMAVLRPLAKASDITLVLHAAPGLPAVQADYARIRRVLANLVVNAVKFSRPGGEVRLSAEPRGSTVRFSVVDKGAGIPAEHLDHLFDRFWQADVKDRRGIGLGLAIAKAIVTAHGGAIGVTSKVGEGSEFWFELPAA